MKVGGTNALAMDKTNDGLLTSATYTNDSHDIKISKTDSSLQ